MNNGPGGHAHARIGHAIRNARRDKGLSLRAMASQLGIASSTMSKLENGLLPLTFQRLESISRLLKVDMEALIAERAGHGSEPGRVRSSPPAREPVGARKSVTRAGEAVPVEGGVYTLYFHGTELLHKHVQPTVAEVHKTDIRQYGPFTQHPGEEFNYVLSGEVDFHTDVYATIRLKTGDSIYFDAEMGHAHTRVGSARCTILAILIPRSSEVVQNNTAPILEVVRNSRPEEPRVSRRPRKGA